MPNNVPASPPIPPTPVNFKIGTSGYPGDGSLGGISVTVGSGATELHDALLGVGAYVGRGALNGSGNHNGNTYVLSTAAIYNAVTLPGAAGATGWTRLITAGTLPPRGTTIQPSNASVLATVQATDFSAPISIQSDGWILRGLNLYNSSLPSIFASAGQTVSAVLSINGEGQPTACARIIVEQCWIHGNPAAVQLARHLLIRSAHDVQVWECWLEGGGRLGGNSQSQTLALGESQPIEVDWGSSRIHIEHCEVIGYGENILIGSQPAGPQPITDVTVKRCHLFKDKTRWQKWLNDDGVTPNPNWVRPVVVINPSTGLPVTNPYTVKNNFEIKQCYRALVDGNVLENNWAQVDTPGFSAGQDGTMLLVNGDNGPDGTGFIVQDILVSNNTLLNGYMGCVTQRVVNSPGPNGNYRHWFVNNLAKGIPGRAFLLNWAGADVALLHNTVVPMNNSVPGRGGGAVNLNTVSLQWAGVGNRNWPRLTMHGNILLFDSSFFDGIRDEFIGGDLSQANLDRLSVDIDGNPLVAGTPIQSGHEFLGNAMVGRAMGNVIDGWTSVGSAAAVGLNTTDGTLASNSPLKVANGWASGETPPKDAGVDFVALAAAQAGTTPLPVPSFTSGQQTGSLTITFLDTSTGSPRLWNWDFGDGSTSTQQNPTHTYAQSGLFTVTLTVTNQGGSAVTQQAVPVAPGAAFTVSLGPGALGAQFTDTSVGAPNGPTAWAWTFGDSLTETVQNPNHTYAAPGAYSVGLTVSNAFGSNGPVFQTVLIGGGVRPPLMAVTHAIGTLR